MSHGDARLLFILGDVLNMELALEIDTRPLTERKDAGQEDLDAATQDGVL